MSDEKLSYDHQPRAQWKSHIGFILAAIGSAVGLGNVWRFSYLCYKNGGGAFLIPYAIALFVVGVPLMILELGLGHKMRGSSPLSFARISRKWEWCGWWAVICAMFGIMLYYSVIVAWCLNYVFFSFNLSWGADPNNFFFKEYLQVTDGPFNLGSISMPILGSLIAIWGACWFIVFFGIEKGVERANKIFMPLLFVLILILVGWAVSLEGASAGLAVYLKPDFSLLSNPQIWIDAFSQIFFTLSLAFGIMIVYASYLPRKANIVKDALIICVGNSLFSFVAGFAVFGTLGYMATVQGVPVSEVVKESIGLAFVAYPQAISLMPQFAEVFGAIFFASLVIAGLSSAISLVEAFSSAVIDKFNYTRSIVVTFVCILGLLGSLVFATQGGLYWLDIVDHFITHYGLVIIGLLECLVIGWVLKAGVLRKHINEVASMKLVKIWDVAVKFIVPIVLVVLLINDLRTELSTPYEGYPVEALIFIGVGWPLAALIAAVVISRGPWVKESPDYEI
ncbi:MAG: NSS family neurotransmitter:Na+ symporter [Candidatus Omnitrophota bacterium]|jgi:NSS family neurotransmitter:Na+ symporter